MAAGRSVGSGGNNDGGTSIGSVNGNGDGGDGVVVNDSGDGGDGVVAVAVTVQNAAWLTVLSQVPGFKAQSRWRRWHEA